MISFLKDANTATMKYYDLSGTSSKYIVNVTSITSTELRGTFTGNYLYDNFDQESLPITEGEFFVKRIR